jgi:hypothetical protein
MVSYHNRLKYQGDKVSVIATAKPPLARAGVELIGTNWI